MSDFYSLTPALGDETEKAFEDAHDLFLSGHGYYEFGVFKGFNMWRAWQAGQRISRKITYHGFDSFEGMPPNDSGERTWQEGSFAISLEETRLHLLSRGVVASRLHLYKGWFSAKWFSSLRRAFPSAGVVVIDSDLYESAVEALCFIAPYLVKGTVILFDDWYCADLGEQRAWHEFMRKHPRIETEEYDYGPFCRRIKLEAI